MLTKTDERQHQPILHVWTRLKGVDLPYEKINETTPELSRSLLPSSNMSRSSTLSNNARNSAELPLMDVDASRNIKQWATCRNTNDKGFASSLPICNAEHNGEKLDSALQPTPKPGIQRASRRQKRFVGVRQRPSGRWVSEIKDSTQKIRLWLGTFDSEEEAARAYDDAARALRGANTKTNFAVSSAETESDPRPRFASKTSYLFLKRVAGKLRHAGSSLGKDCLPVGSPLKSLQLLNSKLHKENSWTETSWNNGYDTSFNSNMGTNMSSRDKLDKMHTEHKYSNDRFSFAVDTNDNFDKASFPQIYEQMPTSSGGIHAFAEIDSTTNNNRGYQLAPGWVVPRTTNATSYPSSMVEVTMSNADQLGVTSISDLQNSEDSSVEKNRKEGPAVVGSVTNGVVHSPPAFHPHCKSNFCCGLDCSQLDSSNHPLFISSDSDKRHVWHSFSTPASVIWPSVRSPSSSCRYNAPPYVDVPLSFNASLCIPEDDQKLLHETIDVKHRVGLAGDGRTALSPLQFSTPKQGQCNIHSHSHESQAIRCPCGESRASFSSPSCQCISWNFWP